MMERIRMDYIVGKNLSSSKTMQYVDLISKEEHMTIIPNGILRLKQGTSNDKNVEPWSRIGDG